MIEKTAEYFQEDYDFPLVSLVDDSTKELVKTANYAGEVASYLANLKPEPDYIYALINALTAGEYYGCFFEGENVLTENGYTQIELISRGDKVLTRDNSFKPVEECFSKNYSGDIVKIKAQNIPLLQKSTVNHPFLSLSSEKVNKLLRKFYKKGMQENLNSFKEGLSNLFESGGSFVSAEFLKKGDFLAIPISPKCEGTPVYSNDDAQLFGYYLAEGCLAKRYDENRKNLIEEKVVFIFNTTGDIPLIEKLKEICNNYDRSPNISKSNSSDNAIRFAMSHKILAQQLKFLFGKHSSKKFIHPFIFNQTEEWIKLFLASYLDGNGYINNTSKTSKYYGSIKFSTVSETLAMDLIRLFAKIGIVVSASSGVNKNSNGCFGNKDHLIYELGISKKQVKKILGHTLRLKEKVDLSLISENDDNSKTNLGYYLLDNFIITKIKSKEIIKNNEDVQIYNIQVAENNTYVTKFIGHNSNRNGDYFPEDALKQYHNTFVENGHVYKNHQNKDPLKSFGKVIFSHYNEEMKRVELVVRLIKAHEETKKIIAELQKGGPAKIRTSMGAKLPFDVCSITGKQAKTREEYSEYLKHKMNQVLDDGRKVFAINTKPRFFDISIVVIPADPVSSFMSTIGLDKIASVDESKEAQIKKQIDAGGSLDFLSEDPQELIIQSQKRIPEETLAKLATYPLNEVLSTFMALRIFPLKEDFQKLALYSKGQIDLANNLEKAGLFFESPSQVSDYPENVGPEQVNEKIAELFSKNIFDYSLTKPFIINRIIEKNAAWPFPDNGNTPQAFPAPQEEERSFINKLLFDKTPSPPDSGVKDPTALFMALGTLYAGYAKLFGESANMSDFSKFIGKNPWVGPLLGLGLGIGVTNMQENMLNPINEEIYGPTMRKTAARDLEQFFGALLVSTPATYYYSSNIERKARQGQPISKFENFVREHPMVAAAVGTYAGSKMYKSMMKSVDRLKSPDTTKKNSEWFMTRRGVKTAAFTDSSNTELINIIYNELIS